MNEKPPPVELGAAMAKHAEQQAAHLREVAARRKREADEKPSAEILEELAGKAVDDGA